MLFRAFLLLVAAHRVTGVVKTSSASETLSGVLVASERASVGDPSRVCKDPALHYLQNEATERGAWEVPGRASTGILSKRTEKHRWLIDPSTEYVSVPNTVLSQVLTAARRSGMRVEAGFFGATGTTLYGSPTRLPSVNLDLAGVRITLKPTDYLQHLGGTVYSLLLVSGPKVYNTLGEPALRKLFVAFDRDRNKVGLCKIE